MTSFSCHSILIKEENICMVCCVPFHLYCVFFISCQRSTSHIGVVETSSDHQCEIDWYLHWSSLPLHLPSSQVENPRIDWDLMVGFVKHKSSLYLNLADFVLGMALVVLTCVNLSVLGVYWVQGSGCIPEHLTQVAPKTDQSSLCFADDISGTATMVLTLSVDLLTCPIWV